MAKGTGTLVSARLDDREVHMLATVRERIVADWPAGISLPSLSDCLRTLIHAEHERLVGTDAHAAFMANPMGVDLGKEKGK